MTQAAAPQVTYLKDYQAPSFWIETTHLNFELLPKHTLVTATLDLIKNEDYLGGNPGQLFLNGEELELLSLSIDGNALTEDQYSLEEGGLRLLAVPDKCQLVIHNKINPAENTSLEGLYVSKGMYCTQCEAEGFRKITYYLDRPDVMSVFTTTIIADKKAYPVLLSNGNKVASTAVDDDRVSVTWEDPFKKPCYLFALVAGDLECVADTFTTCSGREIALEIFVEEQDLDKCDHAMLSLKNAMRWDEETYGREYDLDIYMIVAVSHFNMGAMENKGLNIFNTSCVLANSATTTDAAFQRVEAVIAHEYFHNWSGNRVTCRDWFQLSLKEGFTVFRDSQFSADLNSRSVKRMEDVAFLRTVQFAEDAGPMAHPIRPASFITIDNFYTVTIYEKGAEIVRMIQTIVGEDGFRKGSDLYFERHDGQAVTTEDFVKAMEAANDIDLTLFSRWYHQAGTPKVSVTEEYDEAAKVYTLHFQQTYPEVGNQGENKPVLIPVAMGLLDSEGNDLLEEGSRVLLFGEAEQSFSFDNINEKPVPSLLRGFSAPIHLDQSSISGNKTLAFLMCYDSDEFNRWNAAQQLVSNVILSLIDDLKQNKALALDEIYMEAFDIVLTDSKLDPAVIAKMLALPSPQYLAEQMTVVDVDGIHQACHFVHEQLAEYFKSDLVSIYQACQLEGEYSPVAEDVALRSLKNYCLTLLSYLADSDITELLTDQFFNADNMTDGFAALKALVHSGRLESVDALQQFYQQWQKEALVIDQWFSVQATKPSDNTLAEVKALLNHDDFELTNPNRVRALVGAFCNGNAAGFHHASGEGYKFLADQVIALNNLNPQIASRMVGALIHWKRYDEQRQALIKAELQRINDAPELSDNVYEVVSKALSA